VINNLVVLSNRNRG